MSKAINPGTGTIYSKEELHAAFSRVQNSSNWKMPVHAMIPATDEDVTREAVIFYAGCVPTFRKPTKGGFEGQLIVSAVGYYNAVGA
jgi:hypothetical protein